MGKPVFTEFEEPERKRTYHYADDVTTIVVGAARLSVSESGTHRIETAAGTKHIVAGGWVQIVIDADSWSM